MKATADVQGRQGPDRRRSITANRLDDGRVVFLDADGGWARRRSPRRASLATRRRARRGDRLCQGAARRPHRGRALSDRRRRSSTACRCRRGCASASAPPARPTATIYGEGRGIAAASGGSDARPSGVRSRTQAMYRYDEFDQEFVQRAGRRSSATRSSAALAGELTEDQFRPLRLMNGVYLQLHAYMLRIAIPYGTLNSRAAAQARHHRAANTTRGYGHFTTRQNIQFNWPALKDMPDILERSRRGRDARHPDLGQLHPQRHRRPFRRRRRRRDRRSAALCRDPAAVVVAASGIHLPAAQVQDRRDRRRARPRRDPGPRHRPAAEAQRRRASSASRSMSAAAWAARR